MRRKEEGSVLEERGEGQLAGLGIAERCGGGTSRRCDVRLLDQSRQDAMPS